MKRSYPVAHNVPISKAIRIGDLVVTSAFGPWLFDPAAVKFDENGNVLSDGSGNEAMAFDDQVHRTFEYVIDALQAAGASLSDVVAVDCWLADPRDFMAFNAIYARYFASNPPARTVFPSQFMFACKVEMRATAVIAEETADD